MSRVTPCHRVDPCGLTPREREVLDLVRQGLGRREIAHMLNITVGAVSTRLTVARDKARALEDHESSSAPA